jgi:hypothetical protein|tara:strand:+ start:983 stop:2158 length:1176 start_codon:yes stop_codon:yes gene_type:complete
MFLFEAKNLHLEHLEDEIINKGPSGVMAVSEYIEGVASLLSGTPTKSKLTVKWDGAPAIICGTDPRNGRFFVGTKGVFAKTPKVAYTPAHIRQHYQGQLADKMDTAFIFLRRLGIKSVLQGDFLFDEETKQKQGNTISFQPNTIVYQVESGTELYNQIDRAKFGIAFHTTYVGERLADMDAQFGADISGLKQNPDVWVDDATIKNISGTVTMSKEEQLEIQLAIKYLNPKAVDSKVWQAMMSNSEFINMFKIFVNSEIKKSVGVTQPTNIINKFATYYRQRKEQELANLKMDKAKQVRIEQIRTQLQFLSDNKAGLGAILSMYNTTIKAKNIILSKLKNIQQIGTFKKTGTGLEVTDPEGFVAINAGGNAVKLVDRLAFSRTNLTTQKSWT